MKVIKGVDLHFPRANITKEDFVDKSIFDLTCINTFRLCQNQRKLLPLTSWAQIIIHKHLFRWAKTLHLSVLNFIKLLIAPIHLKNTILIDFLCCERHNDYEYTDKHAQPDMHALYIFNFYVKHTSDYYFIRPAFYETERYFSKSLLFYFYLKYLERTKTAQVFFTKLSRNIPVHDLLQTFLEKVVYIPRAQCPEVPLFLDNYTAVCQYHDYYINPRLDMTLFHVREYDCHQWVRLKHENYLKLMSAS